MESTNLNNAIVNNVEPSESTALMALDPVITSEVVSSNDQLAKMKVEYKRKENILTHRIKLLEGKNADLESANQVNLVVQDRERDKSRELQDLKKQQMLLQDILLQKQPYDGCDVISTVVLDIDSDKEPNRYDKLKDRLSETPPNNSPIQNTENCAAVYSDFEDRGVGRDSGRARDVFILDNEHKESHPDQYDSPEQISTELSSNATLDSYTNKKVYNNWTKINSDTVHNWKRKIAKSSFVYDYIKEKVTNVLQSVMVWTLILSSLQTVMSAVSSSILGINPDNKDLIWVSFGINAFLFVTNGISTFLLGAIKIYKWDETVTALSTHITKIDQFYSIVSAEMVKPDKLRHDASEFITKHDDMYLQLMQQSPSVKTSDVVKASEEYNKFIEEQHGSSNYKCSQKYVSVF